MRAVTFAGLQDFRVTDLSLPGPLGPRDALVKVMLAGICGSDLHIYHGHSPIEEGAGIGHELVGVVQEVGAEVRLLKPGDRVVSSFLIACGECPPCRGGLWSQCQSRAILGFGEAFGGLGGAQAEYCLIPAADTNLAPIPAGVSDEAAIFCGDVLATGFFAVERADVEPGATVAVIGAGPVGLMAIMALGLSEAAEVLAIDTVPERLAVAASLGAVAIDPSKVNLEMEVERRTGGLGAGSVIDCVGKMETVSAALAIVRGGGTVSMVGVPSEVSGDFPYYEAWSRGLSLRVGICNVQAHLPHLLQLLAEGRLHPEAIVSHRLSLEEAPLAYRLFDEKKALKVLLSP